MNLDGNSGENFSVTRGTRWHFSIWVQEFGQRNESLRGCACVRVCMYVCVCETAWSRKRWVTELGRGQGIIQWNQICQNSFVRKKNVGKSHDCVIIAWRNIIIEHVTEQTAGKRPMFVGGEQTIVQNLWPPSFSTLRRNIVGFGLVESICATSCKTYTIFPSCLCHVVYIIYARDQWSL